MSIKNDIWIREQAIKNNMINPFSEQVSDGVISYGLSSYGYDMRVGSEYLVFTGQPREVLIDPKNMYADFHRHVGGYCIIPPNSFALAKSVEYFRIPRDVLAICTGKSTYARCGIITNITPLEPEWEGIVTLEISNTTTLPAKIYSGEGIAQVIFLAAENMCQISYNDRRGKYQKQQRLTLPIV